MNANEYCSFEGDAFDFEAYSGMVADSGAPVAEKAAELAEMYDPAIVYTTLSEINSAIPIEDINPDQFEEHVRLEADSYDADNYDEGDNFDVEGFDVSSRRREIGSQAQDVMNRAMKDVARKAKITGKNPMDIICSIIGSNPEAIMQIRRYVIDRGYSPASTTRELCAQFAHARNEHIGDVVSHYDADNFSFRSSKRKAERQKRRLARIADRIARRKARKQGRLDVKAMGDEPEEEQAQTQADAAVVMPTETVSTPETMPPTDNLNPSTQQAEAEVLGEEFEGGYWGEGYTGESDNFLPFLAGAFNLGKNVLKDVSEGRNPLTKGNVDQARDLFRKKSKKKLNYNTQGGAKGIADRETKEIMSKIEDQKAKEYAKKNMPLIIIGVVALLFIGSSMGK